MTDTDSGQRYTTAKIGVFKINHVIIQIYLNIRTIHAHLPRGAVLASANMLQCGGQWTPTGQRLVDLLDHDARSSADRNPFGRGVSPSIKYSKSQAPEE
ncbi:hypothetical protein RRG08_016943 [Elysia crispata]|uniref:Uncharacterized protein n=1 Tax=Elysia crispata TaxID=231223 RepID=A0AAE1A713_9GAST|nr:hypothetical protein RRG08_016943 [Elysia crispata]